MKKTLQPSPEEYMFARGFTAPGGVGGTVLVSFTSSVTAVVG